MNIQDDDEDEEAKDGDYRLKQHHRFQTRRKERNQETKQHREWRSRKRGKDLAQRQERRRGYNRKQSC